MIWILAFGIAFVVVSVLAWFSARAESGYYKQRHELLKRKAEKRKAEESEANVQEAAEE